MTEETAVEYAHTLAELAAALTIYRRSEDLLFGTPGDDGNGGATGGRHWTERATAAGTSRHAPVAIPRRALIGMLVRLIMSSWVCAFVVLRIGRGQV